LELELLLPQPLEVSRAVAAKIAHRIGPTRRHAFLREVRAFQVKKITGKNRQRAVWPKLRRTGSVGFELYPTSVTVFSVATAVWVLPLSVTLEARSEQVAYCAGLTGVQLRTTVPLKPLTGVMVRF